MYQPYPIGVPDQEPAFLMLFPLVSTRRTASSLNSCVYVLASFGIAFPFLVEYIPNFSTPQERGMVILQILQNMQTDVRSSQYTCCEEKTPLTKRLSAGILGSESASGSAFTTAVEVACQKARSLSSPDVLAILCAGVAPCMQSLLTKLAAAALAHDLGYL